MRNVLLRLSAAMLVCLLATTRAATAQPAAEPLAGFTPFAYLPFVERPSAGAPDAVDQQVIKLTNDLRVQAGCQPLSYSVQLTAAAEAHSKDMASNGFFDHIGSDGSTASQRIQEAGYQASMSAENIGAGFDSAQGVVTAWSNSTGHRQNILNCELTEIGVGHSYAAGSEFGHYWAQEFGRP